MGDMGLRVPWTLFINTFALPLYVIRLVQSVHWIQPFAMKHS